MYNKAIELFNKKCFCLLMYVLLVLLSSCATNEPIRGNVMTPKDLETFEIIDVVETVFESTQYVDRKILLETGYNELLAVAQTKHEGKIDIMDISLLKNTSNKNLFFLVDTFFTGYVNIHYITVKARGAVVKSK